MDALSSQRFDMISATPVSEGPRDYLLVKVTSSAKRDRQGRAMLLAGKAAVGDVSHLPLLC